MCHSYSSLSLLLVALFATGQFAAAQLRNSSANCIRRRSNSEIVFLAFYPCSADPSVGKEGFKSELERLEECDLLSVAAINLAVERINDNRILPDGSTLRVIPISEDNPHVQRTGMDAMITQVELLTDIFRSKDSDKIWGVIGPSNPKDAEFYAPIFQKKDLITISYDSESTATNKVGSFYRTLPSAHGSNYGRLFLMESYLWHRVAVLPDMNDKHYLQAAEDMVSIIDWILEYFGFTQFFDSITTVRGFSDTHSLRQTLSKVQAAKFNIVFGFFGPEKARKVLCMANSVGLVSEKHTWILPSYYNPNWWKLTGNDSQSNVDSEQSEYCSNEKMETILESVVFVNNVKYPPVDLSLNEFHTDLLTKAVDLFPSLTEEDLKPYLLRSRATNAYDAVTLLAKSVDEAIKLTSGSNCDVETTTVQAALEKNMECEYCKLNTLDRGCDEICTSTQTWNLNGGSRLNRRKNLRSSDPLLNFYGEILFSQFLDGKEHPIKLLWPEETLFPRYLKNYAVSALEHSPLSMILKLSSNDFVLNESSHPRDFQWKGQVVPDSEFFKHKTIETLEVILISLVVAIGMVAALVLLIFNIVWRDEKIIKASSPRLNVICLIGIILTLPTSFFESLALSSTKFDFSLTLMTIMCHCKFWMYYTGNAVFIATLIIKNWRIYRIFYNKRLRNIGSQLSDLKLSGIILLMVLPVIAVLLVWSASDHIRLEYGNVQQDSENLQFITVRACYSNNIRVYQTFFIIYTAITLVSLFILTFLVANVDRAEFRREGLGSQRAVVLAMLPLPALYALWAILLVHFPIERYRALLWVEFTLTGLLPLLVMIVLFTPNVYYIIKKHADTKREKKRSALKISPLRKKQSYQSFRREKLILKSQLSATEEKIAKLIAQKQEAVSSDSPTNVVQSSSQTVSVQARKKNMKLSFDELSLGTSNSRMISPLSSQSVSLCMDSPHSICQSLPGALDESDEKSLYICDMEKENQWTHEVKECNQRETIVHLDSTVQGSTRTLMLDEEATCDSFKEVRREACTESECYILDVEELINETWRRYGMTGTNHISNSSIVVDRNDCDQEKEN